MGEKKKKKGGGKIVFTVKRAGHLEAFDDRKLYGSAYAACLNAHLPEQQCELVAGKVLKEVKSHLKKHGEKISSSHLSILVHDALEKHDEDAAFLYRTHLDLS